MNLEIFGSAGSGDSLLITASFNCRTDLKRFLSVADKLIELFPPEPPPPAHEPGPEHE